MYSMFGLSIVFCIEYTICVLNFILLKGNTFSLHIAINKTDQLQLFALEIPQKISTLAVCWNDNFT